MTIVRNGLVGGLVLTVAVWLGSGPTLAAQDSTATTLPTRQTHRVYSHLLEPREHPDYDRRAVKPPTWETFKHRTQFTSVRGFGVKDGLLVGFAEEIEKFTRTHELGDVIWPSYDTLFAKNLGDLADEIKRRDFYLFDIWGYVPGSGPGGYWQQFRERGCWTNADRGGRHETWNEWRSHDRGGAMFEFFSVKVYEAGVEDISHVAPPSRSHGRILTLRRTTSIKEEILARPTFFEHFDGVCVDWRYLHEREKAALQAEGGWLKRQGVRIIVDLSSGVNLYPTLRLIDNLHAEYEVSMAVVSDLLT